MGLRIKTNIEALASQRHLGESRKQMGESLEKLSSGLRINKSADLRLNVLNVTNKDYFTAVYRSGAFLYKGDARAVRLTLNLDF